MNVSAKPVERFFKSFLAAALAVTLCPLVSTEKAQAQEVAGGTDLIASAQTAGEDEAEAVDPGESILAPDAPDDGLALTGENGVIEEDAAAGDSDLALQASESGEPIVDWTECGTCQWMIDANGCLIIKPTNGVSGTLENWGWQRPSWLAKASFIRSVKVENSVSISYAAQMFWRCRNLENVDLSGLDTSGCSSMDSMFAGCASLKNLDLSHLSTNQAQTMASMFSDCVSLERLDISGFDTRNATWMDGMFDGCSSLRNVALGENFSFVGAGSERLCSLPTPWDDGVTGLWENAAGDTFAPSEMPDGAGEYTAVFPEPVDGWRAVGDCVWKVDDQGCLVVKPADGVSGTLENYAVATGSSRSRWDRYPTWYSSRESITSARFEPGVKATDLDYLFAHCDNLVTADLSNLDTSEVTSLTHTFFGCKSLEDIVGLGSPESKVKPENMHEMCWNCQSLKGFDFSGIDGSDLTEAGFLFSMCSSLESVNLSGFSAPNMTGFVGLFLGCSSLSEIDLSGFNVSRVDSFDRAFEGCSSLTSLDLAHFDTRNATDMSNMLDGCTSLDSVVLGENFSFSGAGSERLCSLLTPEKDGSEGKWQNAAGETFAPSEVPDGAGVYAAVFPEFPDGWKACGTCMWNIDSGGKLVIKPVDGVSGELAEWKVDNNAKAHTLWRERASEITSVEIEGRVVAPSRAWGMFEGCENMTSANLNGLDVSGSKDMRFMFYGCKNLQSLDLSNFDTSSVTDMGWMFRDCSALRSVNLSSFDTSQVTDMSIMFDSCSSLQSLEVSNFDTSNVANMAGMFQLCSELQSLDVSGFDTAKVTDMDCMFSECSKLEKLDLSNFDTSSVTSMWAVFKNCSGLRSLDLSAFKTSNVKTMRWMFFGCSSLHALDLSNFDTSSVTDMCQMFLGCWRLQSLNLSSFDTRNTTEISGMFPGFILEKVTLGENFTFNGSGTERQCSLPVPSGESLTGSWVDIATGKAYAADEVPNNAAATYCAQRMLLGSDFVVDASDAVYSGEAFVGRVSSDSLKEGVDYDVTYFDSTNAGTASISIVGKGFYAGGTLSYTFKIDPANITTGMVSGVPSKMEATGERLAPEPVVTFNGKTLEKGKDYTVSYGDNVNPGKGSVTVTAVDGGNFTGSATVEFDIEKKVEPGAIDIGNGDYSYVITSGWYHSGVEGYTGKPITPTLAVCTWRSGDDQLREGIDYVFRAWRDADHRDLEGAPTDIGTYYVVFDGIGGYTGTLEAELRIVDPADIGSGLYTAWESGGDGNGDDVLWTGGPIAPKMAVERDDTGEMLEEGADFEIERYLDSDGSELEGVPSAVGRYTVVLAGRGSYTGELERTIEVRPENSLHFAGFSYDSAFAYTGDPVDLNLEVTARDGKVLEEGVHYRVMYSELYDWGNAQPDAPSAVGDYTATVEAIDGGGYVDSVSWISFSIRDVANIGDANLTVKPVTYTGFDGNLSLDVRDLDTGGRLREGGDFEVRGYLGSDGKALGSEPISVGEYSAVLEGKGLYAGEATLSFEIVPARVSEHMVSGIPRSLECTGSQLTPEPTLMYGRPLTKRIDYDVVYGPNTNVGQGTLKVVGKGNFTGELDLTFDIYPKQVVAPEANAGLVYSGGEQTGVAPSAEYEVSGGSATNAGSYTATVSLKDKNNYAWADTGDPDDPKVGRSSDDLTVAWSIAKAPPSYDAPAAISATEGQTLGDLELPEGFSWQDDPSTSVGEAGEHEFMATFTPSDTANYNAVENVPVTVSVSKNVDGWNAVGDCVWKVDDQGCLVIKPANGVSGTLENYTTYVVNYLGNLMPKTPWEDQSDEIVSARFEKGVSAGSDLGCIFWQLHKLESVDFSNLDMSRVKSMHDAFRCCESLKRVDGLGSKGGMALEDATEMFSLCRSLVSVDLADVDMSLLSSANYMFANCGSLESLDLPSVLSPRELAGMLSGCSSLERVDLSGLDTRGVRSMRDMFSGCTSLKYVRLGENFSFSGAGSERLCSLPAPWEDGATGIWCNTEGQTFAPSEVPDGAGTYTAVFPKLPDGWKAIGGCAWKIDDQGCLVIKPANGVSGELTGWKGTYDEPGTPWWERASEITSVKVEGRVIAPSSIWGMFKGCEKMASADLRELDAASVVDIGSMFQGCSSLCSVEFPESGMPRVIDVQSAFMDCASLESVDLSFLKGAVIRGNMEGMLSGCSALGAVDLSGLDISKVTGMANLFRGCLSLKSVNLSGLDTSAVTSMNCMFRDCASLKSLDLSTFATSQLVEMNRMFEGCSSLADLNLSSFDTSKLSCVENRSGMVSVFDGCVSLESVALGEGFTFNGSGTERQCSLPVPSGKSLTGSWVDIATGKAYAADEVPNNAAATYCAQRMLLGSDFVVDASDAVYSGEAFVGRVSSDSLNEGTDYDVAYSDNVDAGTVNISITGKGFYTGALNYTFKINPANITADMVSGVPAKMEATGEQLTPKPTVTFNGKALAEGSDYTVSYGDNKESGKGAVTVAAVEPGNFTGSATVEFDIEKKAESENPDPGTGGGGTDPGTGGGSGGGTDPAPTPDPGQGGGSGSGGGAPVPAPEPQQFAITYHLDGGVNAASNPAAFTAGTAVALVAPTREGYEFQGWFADAKLTKRVDGISADASGDVELWAKWAKKAPAPTFPDVDYSESSWYGKAVTYVAERGLITGYTAGEKAGQFGVGDSLTRAQLATILWRNACPEEAASYDPASAKDETGIAGSADGQYYTAAANWAVENGVISGYDRPDGAKDFAADDDVTFEQLVTILARLCATPEELASAGSDLSAFADGGDASSWSRAAFAWAAGKGLVEGYDTDSGKYLAPTEDVARERVAVVLMRAFEMGILK